ncbi:MAG: hypothetical protein JXR56_04325, partial [Candidatus Cloacimonetes bacterium]|nr:hypothetical protein [Candidatus Cloacimonadota bacterium]
MQFKKQIYFIILVLLIFTTGCKRNVITGDIFLLSEILSVKDNFRTIGYNLSTKPQKTYLVTTDANSMILEQRFIGDELFMKGYANLDPNLVILFKTGNKQSLLTLINEDGLVVKKQTLDFQAERLLLHPQGGYVIPGYDSADKPAVITLDAFWEPSKIIHLKGKYLFDAVLTEGRLTYVSMDDEGSKCHIYTGNMEPFYEFDNPNGSNCSLTTLRNMIQLHYQSSSKELVVVSFNILNRLETTERHKIEKADYFDVTLASDDSFYYITHTVGKRSHSAVYRLKNRELNKITSPELKNSLLTKPYDFEDTLLSVAYNPANTIKNRIVELK